MNCLLAGYADKNASLFRRLGVALGDPAAFIQLGDHRIGLVRDLEMDRVRQSGAVDEVTCPADQAGDAPLSADRETATAQATANMLAANAITTIDADRSLPLIFAWHLNKAGIEVRYDEDLGVIDRRVKTEQEIQWLAAAQRTTEQVMQMLCQRIATADVDATGILLHAGQPLTSERVRSMAAVAFLKLGYTMGHGAICATAPHVADCHHAGAGPLRTRTPVILDLFPRCEATRYWGDCTRTVVHGSPTDEVEKMHAAVVAAKAAGTALLKTGNTAQSVQRATEQVLLDHGYTSSRGQITDGPSIQHGTGHGIGLEVHEPILLDEAGGELLAGEVFTVEPGLYGRTTGGVRVEDMIVVTDNAPRNLNQLHEGLDWRS